MLIKVDGTFSQVLANIIRLSNSVSKSFMHYLDHISQEKDVLSLYTEATEFVDTNNIPLLSKVSLDKNEVKRTDLRRVEQYFAPFFQQFYKNNFTYHFVESWLTHESSDKRNSITKFNPKIMIS